MSYSTGYGARHAAAPARHGGHTGATGHPFPDDLAEEARFMGAFGDDADGADYATRPEGGSGWRNLFHGAGALGSLALMAWVGVWGYGQVMRDVTGVPVVQALEGPMRERPEQPGGEISEHKGLAVNAVKGGLPGQDLAETIRLAPPTVPLAEEDVPTPALAPRPGTAPAAPAPATGSPVFEAPAPAPGSAVPPLAPLVEARVAPPADAAPEGVPTADSSAIASADAPDAPRAAPESHADALARALSEGLAPLIGEAVATGEDTALVPTPASLGVQAAPIPRSEPGVARSMRPASRPEGLTAEGTGTGSVAASPALADPVENDPITASASATEALPGPDADLSPVDPGTRLVQLGAFDSVEEARAAWDDISARFAPLMGDKARVVQEAQAGGRTFWRLRAQGFADLGDARRFCSALVAERTDCIPVVAR